MESVVEEGWGVEDGLVVSDGEDSWSVMELHKECFCATVSVR